MAEVIITEFSNPTSEGVILHTNIPAKIKGLSTLSKDHWVSWDKIGALLFENYTAVAGVEESIKLRKV